VRKLMTIVVLAISGQASGVEVFTNLGQPDSSSNAAIGYNSSTAYNVRYAQGFTTNSAIDYQLNRISVPLSSTGSPVVDLYTDSGGKPGVSTGAQFTLQTGQLYDFTASYILTANTTYWVVLSDFTASSRTKYNWYYSDTFSAPIDVNGSGFTSAGGARALDGSTWSANRSFTQTGISVDAIPVPESSYMEFFALVVLVSVLTRKVSS